MLKSLLDWVFKPNWCKVGQHQFIYETVITKDDPLTHRSYVVTRLQCMNCPYHTNGWTFPRREKIGRFR